jgi:hypothetical protein
VQEEGKRKEKRGTNANCCRGFQSWMSPVFCLFALPIFLTRTRIRSFPTGVSK